MRTGCVLMGLVLAVAGCDSGGSMQRLGAGYAALEQKQYETAVASADAVLRQSPGSAEALYLKGRGVYGRTKSDQARATADINEARALYQRALASSPSPQLQGLIYADLANLAYQQEQYAVAETQWTQAHNLIERSDVRGVILFQIARCRQRLGKWADADKVYAQIGQSYPNTDLARQAAEKVGFTGFWVQVGAYSRQADADKVIAGLGGYRNQGLSIVRKPHNGHFLVMVGPKDYRGAKVLREQLAGTYKDAFLRP